MSPPALAVGVLSLLAGSVAFAQPPQIPADQLAKIKAATVYLKVTILDRTGSGSGFVIRSDAKDAWVVTNDHVIDPPGVDKLAAAGPVKSHVRVVFHSGTADEWEATAEILARDPERDLAIL